MLSVMTRSAALVALLCTAGTSAHAQTARAESTWMDHDRAARDARNRGDWRTSREHLLRMDEGLHGHPQVALAVARASARLGDTATAIATLGRLARMGLSLDLAADTMLTSLQQREEFRSLTAAFRRNAEPIGTATVVATMPLKDFVAEGVAYDASRGRLLVSSIRHSKVVAVEPNAEVRDFIDLTRDGGWSALGLAVDSVRNRLWVSTQWMPHAVRGSASDSGRAAIHRYDLRDGRRTGRWDLPAGTPHEPGDIAVSTNGDLFVSDGRAGMMFVIREGAGRDSLATLVAPGVLFSPQGIAPDPDGRRLFVADYARGIAIVDAALGAVSWPAHPSDVAVNGIDGMILHDGRLIGVQNGVAPDRVVALQLNADRSAVVGAEILARDTTSIREPTHITAMGDAVVFVANGGFDAYEENGRLRADSKPEAPRIARMRLVRSRP
jgi:sugar lactone lactonase YvrE